MLDERYFYEGAKFAVYLVSTVPILLLIVLPLWGCAWVIYRFLRVALGARARSATRRRGQAVRAWIGSPVRLGLIGIALSIVVIQFVMRQPFLYSNLLVARELPDYGWLRGLLLTQQEGLRSLYFTGLVVATVVTASLAFVVAGQARRDGLAGVVRAVLVVVVAIQFLLLPVNYGFLITATPLPRVASLPGAEATPRGPEAWLAWEGKEGVTYFVRDKERRSLVTLPRKDVGRIEITGYDPILHLLFGPPATGAAQR